MGALCRAKLICIEPMLSSSGCDVRALRCVGIIGCEVQFGPFVADGKLELARLLGAASRLGAVPCLARHCRSPTVLCIALHGAGLYGKEASASLEYSSNGQKIESTVRLPSSAAPIAAPRVDGELHLA